MSLRNRRRMPARLLVAVLAMVAAQVPARADPHEVTTFRVGSHVLSVGDPVGRVIDLLGQPEYKEPVENRFGAYRGERWVFRVDDHDLTVIIRDAHVARMEDDLRR